MERLDQGFAHRVPGDHHHVHLLGVDQPPDLVRIEPRHQDHPVAGEALAHHAPLGRTVHERRDRKEGDLASGRQTLLDHLLRPLHADTGQRVDSSTERVEDVLVAPDDAFRHPGRPARVEDVVIATRSRREVSFRALCGERLFVGDSGLAR